jgi:hypothetical protein
VAERQTPAGSRATIPVVRWLRRWAPRRRTATGLVAVAVMSAAISGLSGCEVSQINWGNRSYTVSGGCVHLATVTLHNGQAVTPDGVTVQLQQVHLKGDINGDGVADAVLYFACTKAGPGGTQTGGEIQVFTRNAKPLARVLPPYFYLQPLGAFDPTNIKVTAGNLLTGTRYANGVYAVFQWDWNGHGFTPVYVSGKHN